ncbi:MAG: SDR family oxidoreductase [Acidimicrobiia bacterium]|nr:SDR family oxidoreductase [Acidimicrobiia bacterium]
MTDDRLSLGAGLSGRGVIVTGAASGIGRATARLAAACGARVCGVDVNGPALRAETREWENPDSHLAIEIDLTGSEAPRTVVDRVLEEFDDLWGLVHCAGVLIRRSSTAEITREDWDIQHDVNLKASFFLNQAVGEALKARGGGGRMITLSSQGWWTGGSHGSVVYSASKGGIVSMCRGLSTAYAPHGIMVNSIAPGVVDTPMLGVGLTSEDLAALAASCPMGRLARPEEIARVAVFLLSTHASYISAATINVSGGLLIY